jgi:hypothetical protein
MDKIIYVLHDCFVLWLKIYMLAVRLTHRQ